jgi:hypothetical protein
MAHFDIAHDSVTILRKGSSICMRDIWYEVIRTTTEQDEASEFVTFVTLLELTADGDDSGKAPVVHNLDMIEYTY